MTSKFLSLIAGAAALGLVGAAANAAEPLTDAQMDGVTAGCGSCYTTKYINDRVSWNTWGRGNQAQAYATADAYGDDTRTETRTFAGASDYNSYSNSYSGAYVD